MEGEPKPAAAALDAAEELGAAAADEEAAPPAAAEDDSDPPKALSATLLASCVTLWICDSSACSLETKAAELALALSTGMLMREAYETARSDAWLARVDSWALALPAEAASARSDG